MKAANAMETSEYTSMRALEDRHWWYAGLHDLVLRLMRAEAARRRRPLNMLDAGCGTGRLCQLLQPYGTVAGCDIHPLAVEAAAARGVHPVLRRDLMTDDLGAEQYDLITAMDVLYHQRITDEAPVLRNLHRALRPGGLLLVQVAAFEALRGAHDVAVHTRRRYRLDQVIHLLEAAGFKVEMASYRLCPFFLPGLLWRCFTRKFPPGAGGGTVASDVPRTYSSSLNQLLTTCVKAENHLLTLGVRLPFGTSVFVAAGK
ncbi:MAG: class I SAM-dependent methyltransferase [Verrucomicrobia bacterium]|nr:class I SAM-dependent methyltransferase [Verrucomicrobiota bacterium]